MPVENLRLLEAKETKPLNGKIAVITGTSRGIGRSTALELAKAGATVVGCFVSEKSGKLQDSLKEEIESFGGNFVSVRADITTCQGRSDLLSAAQSVSPNRGIDILIANAAGGFEKDQPDGWADIINHKAQVALAREFLPNMNPDGNVVYITSHYANKFGKVRMLPYYGEIARTKHEAQEEFMGILDEFDAWNVKFGVVCGPLSQGTGAFIVFEHLAEEKLKEFKEKSGNITDANRFGKEICDFIISLHESGDIHVFAEENIEPIPAEHVGEQELDKEQIERVMEMYDNSVRNRVMIDRFKSSKDRRSGTAWYTPRDEDAIGHFRKEYGGPVLPAHERLEMGAQALGLVWKSLEPDVQGLVTLDGLIGDTDFTGHGKGGFIFPGDEVEIRVKIISIKGGTSVTGKVELFVGDREVTTFEKIKLGVVPNKDLAVRVTDRARRRSNQIKFDRIKQAQEENPSLSTA